MKVGRAKFGGYTLFTTDGYRRLHKYWSINTLAIYRNQTEASHGRIYSDQTVTGGVAIVMGVNSSHRHNGEINGPGLKPRHVAEASACFTRNSHGPGESLEAGIKVFIKSEQRK